MRLSFPTAIIAQRVQRGELPLGTPAPVVTAVHAFLTEHQGRFEIGMIPLDQYLRRAQIRLDATPDAVHKFQAILPESVM